LLLACRDELAIIESFASSLSVDTWVNCKFEMINRPVAPVLVLTRNDHSFGGVLQFWHSLLMELSATIHDVNPVMLNC
jgi:hypothetical protein